MQSYKLGHSQIQKQVLSAQMTQYMQILPLPLYSLNNFLNRIAEENPLVEMTFPQEELYDSLNVHSGSYASNSPNKRSSDPFYKEFSKTSDPLSTLKGNLYLQLLDSSLSGSELELAKGIIESIDSAGYFREDIVSYGKLHNISENKAKQVLKTIQSFYPRGIGARNLSECLSLQIPENYQLYDEAVSLLKDTDLLQTYQINKLAKKHHLSVKKVQKILEMFRTLNPYPGYQYVQTESSAYIYPDIIIHDTADNDFYIAGHPNEIMKINSDYLSELNHCGDVAAIQFIKEKKLEVHNLVSILNLRHQTLSKLAIFLCETQKDFFLYGKKHLYACSVQQAAQRLGLHQTTINRCIQDKYVQTKWGTYPIRFFFSSTLTTDQNLHNKGISTPAVKEMICQLIEHEKKDHPLGDQKIAEILLQSGINISRRTVAKYRCEMNINSSHLRRRSLV